MQNFTKTLEDMQEMAKSSQSFYTFMPVSGAQGSHFWLAQDTFLKEFEKFSEGWFKRRHEGTQTAIELSQRLADEGVSNPTTTVGLLTQWQSHSMERLTEDMKDFMEMVTGCTAAAVTNEVEAVEETVETAKRATKTVKSEPV